MKPDKNRWKHLRNVLHISMISFVHSIGETHYETPDWEKDYDYTNWEQPIKIKTIHSNSHSDRPKNWGKNRRRSTNGGFRYGEYNRRKMTPYTKRELEEKVGKSSRQFSKMKKEWWNGDF